MSIVNVVTDRGRASRTSRMTAGFVRVVLAIVAVALASCGGKIAGDDQDSGSIVPVEETGNPDYTRCDEKLSGSWNVGCDGSNVAHGELCSTSVAIEGCLAATNGCDAPSPDEIVLACDPGFFSQPGAKIGVDIDPQGCVTSVEYAAVDDSIVQCALARLTKMRFPCNGSTTIITPCTPFH